MLEFKLTRDIAAPIDKVFARAIDFPGAYSWLPPCVSSGCEFTSELPVRLGTTYVDHMALGDIKGKFIDFDPPHRAAWEGLIERTDFRMYSLHTYTLVQIDTGTQVTREALVKLSGSEGEKLLPKFRKPFIEQNTLPLDALKQSFESG